MSDDEAFGSDSSDEDYAPIDGEAVSEEEVSGDEEDTKLLVKDAEDGGMDDTKRNKKEKKKLENFPTRKRAGGIKLDDGEEAPEEKVDEEKKLDFNKEDKVAKEIEKEQKEKKKSDDLWASFMSDVGGPPPKARTSSGIGALSSVKKSGPSATKSETKTTSIKPSQPDSSSKVTITKEFDFAGESVKITKEVDANSAEAKVEQMKLESGNKSTPDKPTTGIKRPGGLGNLMGKLNKAPKISTLDKSKLDWESFKQENKITEELTTHNRGKEGFLERKAFLERTDLRQFEMEKSVRLSNSKR